MATDATGTPTALGIPKLDVSNDAPSGLGFNAAMDELDALLAARIELPASPSDGDGLVYDAGLGKWVAQAAPTSTASVTPVTLNAPDTTGFAYPNIAGLTAWKAPHWVFTQSQDARVYGNVLVPTGVTNATFRLVLAANSTTGNVTRFNIATTGVAAGSPLNPAALTSAAAQDVAMPTSAYQRKDVTWSLTGLVGGDLLIVQVFHNGAHANDTLAEDSLVLGAWLEPA